MQNRKRILETYDGTTDGAQADGSEEERLPLESVERERPPSPKIKLNLVALGLADPNDPNRFNRDRLYGAIVRGNPNELEGLEDYLRGTNKFLTDSEYKDGKTGKTCLMKALLNLKDEVNLTIPLLLEIDRRTGNAPQLINAECIGYYKGHTALHIAIEKRNLDLIKFLVENGANVHAKACGEFFQQRKKGVCFYFGELPLSLAACTNQPDVLQYLLHNPHQKARLEEQDSLGNTVFHALVMVANDTEKNTELVIKMYDELLKEGAKIDRTLRLEEIVNKKGLTPLKLAVKTGKVEIFKHIIRREIKDPEFCHLSRKFTEWTYGPVHISLYDLSAIDSYEENSVLEILAYSSDTPNRYKMVDLEPVNKLLEQKWDSFAAKRFFLSFWSYLAFMLVFTAVAYNLPLDGKPPFPVSLTAGDILKLTGQVIVLLGGIYLLIIQSLYLWKRHRFLKSLLTDDCIQIFLLVQAIALLLSSLLYLVGLEEYVPWMVFSLLLGWVNLLYYTRGFQQTGIYIVMIQKAILRDLLHFLIVYVIFLFGFATALVILTGEAPQTAQNGSLPLHGGDKDEAVYPDLFKASLALFRFTIGMGDLEFHENVKFKYFVMVLLLLFVVLTYILLLNMLIALMSETVTNVSGYGRSVWKLQRAIAILEIEKNWFWCWKKTPRSGCFLSINPEEKENKRWFLRVEEVNWADWKKEQGVLKEDPVDSNISETEPQEDKQSGWVSRMRALLAVAEEDRLPTHATGH
ncbi:transient receptor potential cation channel subfamily V member 2-like [Elgaria multicarinata webbii]|uniref:transient receptor potential cation channel subfamily V member 2-like n=1 Tax=Elgaria multicarinata webbii TaxID=159646 RepID=UPI002FCD099D